MMWDWRMVALIPARAGSQRCPGKNTRLLNGHPLLAYSIAAAKQSGLCSVILVSTDSEETAAIAKSYGASVRLAGSPCHTDTCADIVWIQDAFRYLQDQGLRPETFAILRPTSPFRTAQTLQRAFPIFQAMSQCGDSIRAVEPVRQHPGKMWTWEGRGFPIVPILPHKRSDGVPWHSCPTQTLPMFYVQNSSLEMGWTANVEVHGTIHGKKVAPFFTEGYEGLAIDTEDDWQRAVQIATAHPELLPTL
jgi:CMP-N,N'-diacetyllegionaminic acid synthase